MSVLLLELEGHWYSLGQGQLTALASYPVVDEPRLLISDLADAPSGTLALDERSAFAESLVEHRLRHEGLVDGECKVLIHSRRKLGGGFQALYTAVAIDTWQRLLSWADKQREHCLVIPLLSLLWRGLPTATGVVVRTGQRLLFCGRGQDGPLYAVTMVFSESRDDLLEAVARLADQINEQVSGTFTHLHWCLLNAGDSGAEEDLVERFAALTGLRTELKKAEVLLAPSGERRLFSLAYLRSNIAVRDAVNPPLARLAFILERSQRLQAASGFALATGLALLAGYWYSLAQANQAEVVQIATRTQALEQRSAALSVAAPETRSLEALLERLDQAVLVAALPDPYGEVAAVRAAAGDRVRILRIRSSAEAGEAVTRVEGIAEGGDNALGAFLQRLLAAGYRVVADDGTQGAGQPAGFFSYQLRQQAAL